MTGRPKAVILVGGQGTRLQPLTFYMPKPMVPVLNRPFMEHTLAYLRDSGVDNVVLAISYLPQVIHRYFGNGASLGLKIDYSIEVEPLGTAGAVKNAERHLDRSFLVLNGDIFTDLDIADLLDYHRRNRAKATIALTWVDNPAAFGVVETEPGGKVRRFIEKPPPGTETTNWINAGIYVLEPEVMRHVPVGQFHMFERGLFPRLLELGEPVYGYPFRGYWLDMGNVSKYRRLNCDLLLGNTRSALVPGPGKDGVRCDGARVHHTAEISGPVIIGAGTSIGRKARIAGPVIIGEKCAVSQGASVSDSILWSGARVSARSKVSQCVVGSQVRLAPGTEATRCVLTSRHPACEISPV